MWSALLSSTRSARPRRQDVLLQVDLVDVLPDLLRRLARLVPATGSRSGGSRTRGSGRPSGRASGTARCTTSGCATASRRRRSRNRRSPTRRPAALSWAGTAPVCSTLRPSRIMMSGCRTICTCAGDDVVVQVRVDGRGDLADAGLHVGDELQQPLDVVALGEALPVHDAARLQHAVRVEEAVGGDQVDLRMVRPAGEQLAQDARAWCSCRPRRCRRCR